jgi:hypothetical protein
MSSGRGDCERSGAREVLKKTHFRDHVSPSVFCFRFRYPIRDARKCRWIRYSIRDFAATKLFLSLDRVRDSAHLHVCQANLHNHGRGNGCGSRNDTGAITDGTTDAKNARGNGHLFTKCTRALNLLKYLNPFRGS